MENVFSFVYKDKAYPVKVIRKGRKYIYFRWDKKGEGFLITCPRLTSTSFLKEKMIEQLPKMIEKKNKIESPIDGDHVYIFGEKKLIEGFSELDERARNKYLGSVLGEYISYRCPQIKAEMGVPFQYEYKIRSMKTRYGVNNKKRGTLTFSTVLVHYSKEIIDSVIYHEFSHYYAMNHGDAFHNTLDKYCPNYNKLRKKLIRGEYA